MEALLIHYLGNQRASLILIIQIASACVSRIVPHTVSHTPRMRLECVSNAYHNRNAANLQHGAPIGGSNHQTVDGVTRATDMER